MKSIYQVICLVFLTTTPFIANGQTVSNPVGTTRPVHHITEWNDNLIIAGTWKTFGVPLNGYDTIDYATGKLLGSRIHINGSVSSSILNKDGSYILAGSGLILNGVSCSQPIVFIDSAGTIDTSLALDLRFLDQSYWPFRWVKGGIGSMVRTGDTLIVAGQFSEINSERRTGIAMIDIKTKTLLDWTIDLGYVPSCDIQRIGNQLFISGIFLEVFNHFNPYIYVLDLKTLEPVPVACPDKPITNIKSDSSHVYINGKFDQYGKAVGGLISTGNMQLNNLARAPRTAEQVASQAVSAIAYDNLGGYFTGTVYDDQKAMEYRGVNYVDSNHNFRHIVLSDSLYDVNHLDLVNDTLIIIGGSPDTVQILHYFDVKSWKQIPAPAVCEVGPYPCTYKRYDDHHFVLSKLSKVNGNVVKGDILMHRSSGKWEWLPTWAGNFERTGDTLYFTGNSRETSFNFGPVVHFSHGSSAPERITYLTGSVQSVVSDGNGGYYMGGDIGGFYERIVHILPDGTEDPDFNFRMWQSATIRDMVVVGDTLFVAGNYTSQSTIPTGSLILIDISSNSLIRYTIDVDGEINDLERVGDTLFLSGAFTAINNNTAYHHLAAINPHTMNVYNWQPGFNNTVTSICVDSAHLYAVGAFDSCSGRSADHVVRFNRTDLSADTAFALKFVPYHPSYIPDFNVVRYHKGKLYIGGRTRSATTNGKKLEALIQLDLTTDSVSDLGLGLGHNYYLYDIAFAGDTMYLAGSFRTVKGENNPYFAAVTLPDTGLLRDLPPPSDIARDIYVEKDGYWVSGDFVKFGAIQGDYFKYNVRTKQFLESPNYGIFGTDLVRIKNHLFMLGNNKTINGFRHNSIYKFDLNADTLLEWSPACLENSNYFGALHLVSLHDTICLIGRTYVPANPELIKQYDHVILMLEPDSGKLCSEFNINNSVSSCYTRDNKLIITGKFNLMDYGVTKMTRLNVSSLEHDLNFFGEYAFREFEIFDKDIWGIIDEGRLYKRNKKIGYRDTMVVRAQNPYETYSQLTRVDSLLYINGDFKGITQIGYNPIASTNYNYMNRFMFDPQTEKVAPGQFSFHPFPKVSRHGNILLAHPESAALGMLSSVVDSSQLVKYNKTDGSIETINLGQMNPYYPVITQVRGDKLYIANARVYMDKTRYGIIEYDLESNTIIREIANTGECNDMVIHENYLISGNNNGKLLVFDLNTNQQIPGAQPTFDGKINSIYVYDTVIYVGGEFTEVNNVSSYGLARIHLNTLNVIPFRVPFSSNCKVRHLNGSGNYLMAIGSFLAPVGNGDFAIFDLRYESLYPFQPTIPGEIDYLFKSHLVKNQLFIIGRNTLEYPYTNQTLVYDFNTGKRQYNLDKLEMNSMNLFYSDNALWLYGLDHDQTNWSKNHISRITGDIFSWKAGVTDYSPEEMGRNKDARMTITGFGFTDETTFWLQNQSDTLHPLDSTIMTESSGFILSGLFKNIQVPEALYDLVVEIPGDSTIIIEKAVKVASARFGKVTVSIHGRDTIRPDVWSNFTFEVSSDANYDHHNLPVFIAASDVSAIKVREVVYDGKNTTYDGTGFSLDIDSIQGRPFKGKMVSFILPEIPANSHKLVTVAVKSDPQASNIGLRSWFHGPLSGIAYQGNVANAYADLFNIDSSCADQTIGELEAKYNAINEVRANNRGVIMNFRSWIDTVGKRCSPTTIDAESILVSLVPDLSSDLASYTSNGANEDSYNGTYPYIDSIQSVKNIVVINSSDPNIKIGFKGVGEENYTTEIPGTLNYAIHFENDSAANASVQNLLIVDSLDVDNLDVTSLKFTELSLGPHLVTFNGLQDSIDQFVLLDQSDNFLIRVTADVDQNSGVMTCRVEAVDRLTLLAEDLEPTAGFLPPNRDGENGHGYLSFYIDKIGNPLKIENKANIFFDKNDPIPTPVWKIALDTDPPASEVTDLVLNSTNETLAVNWDGVDNGSGIAHYSVYYSMDNVNYQPLTEKTDSKNTSFGVENSKTYYFYSIAEDRVGNVEDKSTYDLMILVEFNSTGPDLNSFIKIYPNPTASAFTVEVSQGKWHLNVINGLGQVILRGDFTQDFTASLDNSGVYILQLTNESGKMYSCKLVVQ